MKKNAILTILFSAIIGNIQIDFTKHAQFLLDAYRAKQTKQHEKALGFYESAFSLNKDNSIAEYLSAAESAAKINKKRSCKKWLKEAITSKKAPRESISQFSKNELYQQSANEVLANYDGLLAEYYNSLENPAVYFQIQELINRDQFSRKIKDYHLGLTEEDKREALDKMFEARKNKDQEGVKKYRSILFPTIKKELRDHQLQIMRYTDSLNISELIKITKKHGWQPQAHLLLWHQRGTYGKKNWVWNHFKPLIDAEIKAGKVAPSFWALYEDITSIYKTGESIYGYHPGKVNPKTVNQNRRKIGLPLLTEAEIASRNNRTDKGKVF